jgi:undecaprenyl-diphosphatase
MLNFFQSVILGIIQGATEFLPISSSAHLVLAPWLFGWPDPGLAFDVALHWGTLIGVVFYFWRDLWDIAANLEFKIKRFGRYNFQTRLFFILVIASIPGAVFGWLLNDLAETAFRSPILIAFLLAYFGVIIWLADKRGLQKKNPAEVKMREGFLIGFSQALAIVPGVSRSGATISAGLFLGLSRSAAARFSFLLSIPIIFGAGLAQIPRLCGDILNMSVLAGAFSAAVSGYLAIGWLLRFVQKRSYKIFVWYRFALSAIIIIIIALK